MENRRSGARVAAANPGPLVIDPDFRDLCRDFDDCSIALERFHEVAETAPERVAEYKQLLVELENDIRRALDE